jgi:hypothetical protein
MAGAFLVLCDAAENTLAYSVILNNHQSDWYELSLTNAYDKNETKKNIC